MSNSPQLNNPKDFRQSSFPSSGQTNNLVSPRKSLIFDTDNIYPLLRSIEIGEELEEFYRIKKNFLIFTEAGKPVYTRYGDEMVMAPFFATMSAIIPKLQSYFWNNQLNAKE